MLFVNNHVFAIHLHGLMDQTSMWRTGMIHQVDFLEMDIEQSIIYYAHHLQSINLKNYQDQGD